MLDSFRTAQCGSSGNVIAANRIYTINRSSMKTKLSIFLAISMIFLAGCSSWTNWLKKDPPTEGGKPTQSAQLGTATTAATNAQIAADDALAKEKEQNKKLLSGLKANVDSAKEFNIQNPDGTAKTKVDGELMVAQGRLVNVEADQAELAAARARALLV